MEPTQPPFDPEAFAAWQAHPVIARASRAAQEALFASDEDITVDRIVQLMADALAAEPGGPAALEEFAQAGDG
jgi:hypothetical protein